MVLSHNPRYAPSLGTLQEHRLDSHKPHTWALRVRRASGEVQGLTSKQVEQRLPIPEIWVPDFQLNTDSKSIGGVMAKKVPHPQALLKSRAAIEGTYTGSCAQGICTSPKPKALMLTEWQKGGIEDAVRKQITFAMKKTRK